MPDLGQPRDGEHRRVWGREDPGASVWVRIGWGGGSAVGEGAPGDSSAATYEDVLGSKKSTANPK